MSDEADALVIVREANPKDAEAIVRLIALLDHHSTIEGVRRRLSAIAAPTLVATLGDEIVGLCGLDIQTHVHREAPVGRITILVLAEQVRGQGIGRLLIDEAEKRLWAAGCELIEVTSNDRFTGAHAFYRRLGYDRTSMRFAKRPVIPAKAGTSAE